MPSMDERQAVEDYLAALPDEQRAALERLRATVLEVAPDAVDVISYKMPALRIAEGVLVWYAAFKEHMSLFPASDAMMKELGDELQPYRKGRGTFRFTVARPLPDELLKRIVAIRRAEMAKS